MTNLEPIDQDSLLQAIREVMPAPVREEAPIDGTLVLIGGDPGEVVVRVRRSQVTVAVFAVVWNGPATPVVRPQKVARLKWRRLSGTQLMTSLRSPIESANSSSLINAATGIETRSAGLVS